MSVVHLWIPATIYYQQHLQLHASHTAANCHQRLAPLQGGGGKFSTSKEISRCRGGRACPSVDLVGLALPRIVSMSDMMHTCCAQVKSKHWQRQKGTEGSVLITSSYTNLDEISISESRLSINFKISTKHQFLNLCLKSWPNLYLASESWPRFNFEPQPNISSKYWPNFSFKISPELQLQNLDQTLCSKPEQKFRVMTKLQLPKGLAPFTYTVKLWKSCAYWPS